MEQITELPAIFQEKDFQNLIANRNIVPADFEIIEKLSHFPKDLFIDHHNYFSASLENTLRDLERDLENRQNELQEARKYGNAENIQLLEQRVAFLALFVEFAKKYDYCACDNLNRVFERRKTAQGKPRGIKTTAKHNGERK